MESRLKEKFKLLRILKIYIPHTTSLLKIVVKPALKIQNSRHTQLNIEKTRFELLRSERVLVYLRKLNFYNPQTYNLNLQPKKFSC